MNLRQLHEEFIGAARRPMLFGKLPIKATQPDVPIVATNRWTVHKDPSSLVKEFQFRRREDRNEFVRVLLDYEDQVGHLATIMIMNDVVRLSLVTPTIDQVTELDKEYASFADSVFRDIVTRPDENNPQY